MSIEPKPEEDNAECESGRQAEAMKAQLRKDVHSWNKARNETAPGHIAESTFPAVRLVPPQPVAKARMRGSAPAAVKPADISSKPFSMSYGGETTKDYMQYIISRGSR
jgi:hypothetical protein